MGVSGPFDKENLVEWPILPKSCFPGFRRFPEAWNTLLSRRRVRRVSMQDAGNLRRRSPAKVALGFACPVHPGKPTKPSAVADVRGSATGYRSCAQGDRPKQKGLSATALAAEGVSQVTRILSLDNHYWIVIVAPSRMQNISLSNKVCPVGQESEV